MNILVIGCSGFIGSAMLDYLSKISHVKVMGVCRNKKFVNRNGIKINFINDLRDLNENSNIFNTVDTIIYTAGKAHAMDKKNSENEHDYYLINSEMTLHIAKIAAKVGVKRFIYLSSVKVFGESKLPFEPFSLDSRLNPIDPYGLSKLEAELGLMNLSNTTKLEITIIRPPIVYGAGVKGNMGLLSKLVKSNLPLPLKSISYNKRSMVSIDNLIDLIWTCTNAASANKQIFLISDDQDLSTSEIICLFKKYLNTKTFIFHFPIKLLSIIGYITNNNASMRRLLESYSVDISHTKSTLSWEPPQSVEDAFKKMLKNNK